MWRLDPRAVLSHPHEVALVLLVCSFALFIPAFWEGSNLKNVLSQAAPLLALSIGQTFVLVVGGIDFTQGALLGLASVSMVTLFVPLGPMLSLTIVLAGSALVGFTTGALVARTRIESFVATMATMYIFGGITMYWTGGTPITDTSIEGAAFLAWLGTASIGPVPMVFVVAAILAVLAHFFLRHLMFGLKLYAVGSNRRAASALGIKDYVVFGAAFALSAAFTMAASVLLTARIRQGNPHLGEGLLFESIGGAVIGGVALTGGVGSVWAATRGVMMLALIQNALYLTDLNSYLRDIAVGTLILASGVLSQKARFGGAVAGILDKTRKEKTS